MTNSLHPPAALRLRVLPFTGKGAHYLQRLPDEAPWQQFLPDGSPLRCRQHLCHGAASLQSLRHSTASQQSLRHSAASLQSLRHGATASNSATAPLPATALPRLPRQQQLCHGVPASNKPHPSENSTPVWLAIWRTWAGFANSQHRNAAFATPDNICAHSSLLPHWAAAQTDANLSAHLHRLPTPPPYLRRMRLSLGLVRRCWVQDEAVA